MSISRQSDASDRIPDTIEEMNAWEKAEEDRLIRSSIDYMLSMAPVERLRRHEDAGRVIRRLEAIAERHGIRPTAGWMITGPVRGRSD
jgi:hypothetical protein